MNANDRLRHIQTNRGRPDRTVKAGAAMARLVQQVAEDGEWTAARDVAAALAGIVDEEFRRHCRLGLASGTALAVRVDKPALVFPMRVRWASCLENALTGRRSGTRLRQVVFEHGTAGASVPSPAESVAKA